MKTKKTDIVYCALFCGFLAVMLVLFLVLPKTDFSEKEKRYLQESPELSWNNVLSGQYGEDVESYIADHVPGRDFFVGLSAYYDLLSGRQVAKDIYAAQGDRLVEAPVKQDQEAIRRNMSFINAFAEKTGAQVDLMIVPSAGYINRNAVRGLADPYRDDAILQVIYQEAGANVRPVELLSVFEGAEDPEDLYYRTDHHWTSLGAYTAYERYMDFLGREKADRDAFKVERTGGFYGTTYARSGLWLTKSEDVELWKTDGAFTVTNENGTPHEGLFYEERLQELDKYTVYLDGNHSLVTIENPENAGKGSLLVIRDSYANCLGTFLAHSYERVVLVDLRYYKQPVSELLAAGEFSDVLVCYSLSNFMTDANFPWLK